MENNIIKGIEVQQNTLQFILSIFSIEDILRLTKYTKRLIVGYDENNIPIYNDNIQRNVENSRVEKIADFLINDPQAIFPTNIVLGIPSNMIDSQTYDTGNVELTIKQTVFDELKKADGDVYITIIDGQHRIRGVEVAIERLQKELSKLKEDSLAEKKYIEKRLLELKNIQLIVSFFIDPSLEFQAMIFSTINRTQKRVSQNLVYSLFGLDENDTPQKVALEIVLALNGHEKSPFYKRIMLYGGTYSKNEIPPLSQSTMVKSIVELICENSRDAEIDRFRKRKELLKQKGTKFLPFRNYYATNNDKMISDIIFYYFSSVRKVYIDKNGVPYWDLNSNNNILRTTVGYFALMKVLVDILRHESNHVLLTSTNFYESQLKKAINIDFSNTERYPFSNKAKATLYEDMYNLIFNNK